MKLPKYNELPESNLKKLIHINDMFRFGSGLKAIKSQAIISGFESIAKVKNFKAFRVAVFAEMKANGLIIT